MNDGLTVHIFERHENPNLIDVYIHREPNCLERMATYNVRRDRLTIYRIFEDDCLAVFGGAGNYHVILTRIRGIIERQSGCKKRPGEQ